MMVSTVQLLSDLNWILEEQEMMIVDHSLNPFWVADWPSRLAQLKLHPEPLIAHMQSLKSHFLGSYFEHLFSFTIHYFSVLTVLAEHAQIQVAGKTYGELDLLVALPDGKLMQCEIALKFYLERPDLGEGIWIGPNKNDSLTKKTQHARAHQLQILNVSEGKRWLSSVTNKPLDYQNLLIYGRFFHSISKLSCDFFAQCKRASFWARLGEIASCGAMLDAFSEMPKPYWITGNIENNSLNQSIDGVIESLTNRFQTDDRPVLYQCRYVSSTLNARTIWIFICPDSW